MRGTIMLFLYVAPMLGQAQTCSFDWHNTAGGEGPSDGGGYAVTGTIGKHAANGPLIGGIYTVSGGFRALINVAQTPGAPTLFISHDVNTVTGIGRISVAGICNRVPASPRLPTGWFAAV